MGFLSWMVLGALAGSRADVRTWKLSGELAGGNLRRGDCALTPDGARAVFTGEYEGNGFTFTCLYSAPADGSGAPMRIYAPPQLEREDDIPVIGRFQLTADSRRVVFALDDDDQALYSVPVDGSAPAVMLATDSQLLAPFVLSPDGRRAVYATDGLAGLFSVPTDGSGVPVRLADAPVPYASEFLDFEVTPDGARVLYTVDATDSSCDACDTPNPVELYSVPIDGSLAPVLLSPPGLPGHLAPPDGAELLDVRVTDFVATPDGAQVVFCTRAQYGACSQGCRFVTRLFRVPVTGSERPTLLFTGALADPRISPGGKRVVYLGHPGDDGRALELLSQSLDGHSDPTRLHAPLAKGGAITSFALTPNGRRVLFTGDPQGLGQVRLFRVPIDGSAPPQELGAPLAPGQDVRDFRLSSDGAWAVYRADLEQDEVFGLHSIFLHARGPLPTFVLTPGVDVLAFELPALGARALFRASAAGTTQLFAVPLDASTPALRLSGAEGASSTSLDARGRRVVYRGALAHASDIHVYGVGLDGRAPPVRLDRVPGPVYGQVESFEFHPDGRHVLFTAGARDFSFPEFHLAALDGSGEPRLLEGLVPADGQLLVERFQSAEGFLGGHPIDPGSGRVVYQVRRPVSGSFAYTVEVYSAPLDGRVPPVRLSTPLVAGGATYDLALCGGRVVYRAEREQRECFELYSAPVDGSEAPRRLNAPLLPDQRGVLGFVPTPDARRVVYAAGRDGLHRELFSVASDGSAAPVRLDGSRIAGNTGGLFQLTPDGTRVVFSADPAISGVLELFVVPVAGGASARRLHAPLAPGRAVTAFALSPDSSRVVYVADAAVDNRFDLFVAPLDGSTPPRALIPAPVAGQSIYDVQLDPSGTYAVYTPAHGGHTRLASVALDGAGAPVELSPPLVAGGNVLPWAAPAALTDAWALYLADQEQDGRVELYAAPLDGHAPAHRVNGPFDSTQDRVHLRFVAQGERAFFLSTQALGGYRFFVAPLDGSRAPLELNPSGTSALHHLSGSLPFRVAADGNHVLFSAASAATFELFAAELEPPHRGAGNPGVLVPGPTVR